MRTCGCLGQRPPPPNPGEPSLNTKRAAHLLGKRVKWLETVRHRPNAPPWIKTGGGFEYFESQLSWWRALLSEGKRDADRSTRGGVRVQSARTGR